MLFMLLKRPLCALRENFRGLGGLRNYIFYVSLWFNSI